MYYDKHFFDWYRNEHMKPPIVWTQLQEVRKKQLEIKTNEAQLYIQKAEAKLRLVKKELRAKTKALTDCQAQLIQRDRQLCVCKIKALLVPVR